jgi:exoribonuclease R
MTTNQATGKNQLRSIAHEAMLQRGLLPDFSAAVLDQTNKITAPATESVPAIRDLRDLLWASIDNDDSRDLDQLSVAEPLSGGVVKILVAIADVDALVKKDSAIDGHAWTNTTSVYTAAETFPMLPEKLSTDLTSLGEGQERHALVIEMTVAADGKVTASDIYRAVVTNRAKLGARFDAIVTGASDKGTWVRINGPTTEGRVVRGFEGLDVGDRVRVELVRTDVAHGFIDFARSS